MKVTVAVPTFDAAGTLGQAIESALAQSFPDFELLVSDNASADGTRELVARYRDPRLRFVRHAENVGYVRNVRSCIERAEGELVAILCADDYWTGEVLAPLVAAFKESPRTTLAYTAYDVLQVLPDGRTYSCSPAFRERPARCDGATYVRDEFMEPYTILACAVFRRDAALAAGSFGDASLRFLPDFVHRLKVAAQGEVFYLRAPRAVYREHAQSITARHTPKEWLREELMVRAALERDPALRGAHLEEVRGAGLDAVCRGWIQKLPYMRACGAGRAAISRLALRLTGIRARAVARPSSLARVLTSLALPKAAILAYHGRRHAAMAPTPAAGGAGPTASRGSSSP